MSKRIALIVAAVFVLVGLGSLAQAATTLTYSNFFPPTHSQSKLAQAWCDEVEKRTDGQVKVQYYPGQTLTKAKQAYDGVTIGLSDLAMGCFAYTRGRFPVMAVVDLPFGYKNGVMATEVVNKVYKELKPEELDNVEVMYLHAHGPGLIFTTEKPVKTLEDIKGMKIRAQGTSARLVKALGASAVTVPMPDVYQALSRGTVDGAAYPTESNKGWKLGEVTKYRTGSFPVAFTTAFFMVMNKAKWEALPESAKKAIREINTEWAVKTAKAWDEADEEGLKFFLSLPGRQDITLSPEEAVKWVQAVQPVFDEYVKTVSQKGLDGKKIVETAKKAVAEAAK